MKKRKIVINKGILFWITGYSGSGKSSIAKRIKKRISKLYGPTILINGDDLRNILELNKYSKIERIKNGLKFSKLCEFITNQNINVIFAVVGLFNKIRKRNKLKIKNYIEIYIKSEIKNIIKKGKKKIYKKNKKNIMGKDLKAELPKNPDITITNDLTINHNIKKLSDELFVKIKKYIDEK